jgi:hypothetical protein
LRHKKNRLLENKTTACHFDPFDFAQGKLWEKSLSTLIKVEVGWQQGGVHRNGAWNRSFASHISSLSELAGIPHVRSK